MSILLKDSKTKDNLMRAFAGESQARNRYTFGAAEAKKQKLHVIETIFTLTANQEHAHAKSYYNLLKEMSGINISVDGNYPVDINDNVAKLLRLAQHNEYEENQDVYPAFAKIATEEGFIKISTMFQMIAKIEKTHGDRFGRFAKLIEDDKLFKSDTETEWMCLNCGHIHKGKFAPTICPVCDHAQGFFIRLEDAPFECLKK